ncbi:hypothetical protein BDN70DRAFT_894664 [Pholiota conissans]|uniref:Uncharacterized protein n=1 Tax=Pholiota conissans TaxID=109636 RepID=A0A9P6D130_9AGAR|nr:hypothetical protein BDN70DRAFT_894664 [Pholiota conissans]
MLLLLYRSPSPFAGDLPKSLATFSGPAPCSLLHPILPVLYNLGQILRLEMIWVLALHVLVNAIFGRLLVPVRLARELHIWSDVSHPRDKISLVAHSRTWPGGTAILPCWEQNEATNQWDMTPGMFIAGLGAWVPFGVREEVVEVVEIAEDADLEVDQADLTPFQVPLLLSEVDGLLKCGI